MRKRIDDISNSISNIIDKNTYLNILYKNIKYFLFTTIKTTWKDGMANNFTDR